MKQPLSRLLAAVSLDNNLALSKDGRRLRFVNAAAARRATTVPSIGCTAATVMRTRDAVYLAETNAMVIGSWPPPAPHNCTSDIRRDGRTGSWEHAAH